MPQRAQPWLHSHLRPNFTAKFIFPSLNVGIATYGRWHCHLWTLASPWLDGGKTNTGSII